MGKKVFVKEKSRLRKESNLLRVQGKQNTELGGLVRRGSVRKCGPKKSRKGVFIAD